MNIIDIMKNKKENNVFVGFIIDLIIYVAIVIMLILTAINYGKSIAKVEYLDTLNQMYIEERGK